MSLFTELPRRDLLGNSRLPRLFVLSKNFGMERGPRFSLIFNPFHTKGRVISPNWWIRSLLTARIVLLSTKETKKMELYLNSTWTERCGNASYVAQAIACSENGNHATFYATGSTADEADSKLLSALRELKLVPEATTPKVEPTA
jgi:hypothetical protein